VEGPRQVYARSAPGTSEEILSGPPADVLFGLLWKVRETGRGYPAATGWSRGLEVTGGGTGIVSHAGLVLLRELADRTGLTAGLSAALPSPAGGHDRGRVVADLACAIADGARVISDFRVMGDQRELFGLVA